MIMAPPQITERSKGEKSPAAAGTVAFAPKIRRDVTAEQICVLTFDRPDSRANLFDRAVLEELNQHLDFVSANAQLKGFILVSAKKSIFIAGADIHA
ncbi:MAG TPA: hypothetical protein VK633_15400, partial [Verrucomicrobiae bacterium]|nr:hypothetical protein [Verrucomicrobiae bacterium]